MDEANGVIEENRNTDKAKPHIMAVYFYIRQKKKITEWQK